MNEQLADAVERAAVDSTLPTRYQVIAGRYPFEYLTITHWTED
ncbi:hypothetical protein [Rhodococcus pyridinivorans]|nr:hypothetical protein [Rhodococcus pyridinivorans]